MRNLSGSTWEKQSRDINFKLAAFGQSRHHQDKEHQTHSDALRIKRDAYKNDFILYLKDNKVDESVKLNYYFTTEIVSDFLSLRINNLSSKSSEDYIRGFGAMIKGLEANNVKVSTDYQQLDKMVKEIKENDKKVDVKDIHRAIVDPLNTIEKLYQKGEGYGLIADVQYNTGLRFSEAKELILNADKYINETKVTDVVGKGNHKYEEKELNRDLAQKIFEFNSKLPSLNSFNNEIKKTESNEDKSSHSFRYSYVMKLHKLGYTDARISKEINHHRLSITRYYLSRG